MCRQTIDDPDLPLERMLRRWPSTASVFLDRQMLCPGCPIARFHSVTDACAEYRLDEEAFRAELRRAAAADW